MLLRCFMCGLTVYHYLNVCYYGGPMLNKKKTFVRISLPYKTEVATDVTDVQMLLILIMNKNAPLHPNSSNVHFWETKNYIIINIMRKPKPVSWFWNNITH